MTTDMNMKTRTLFLAAFALVAVPAGSVRAQSTDPAAAEALFREARKLLEQHDFARACPMLQDSQRLDPAIGTLVNLALCHEAQGKTASAWAEFTQLAALAKREKRPEHERTAKAHAAALEPKLSMLTIEVPVAVRVSDLQVTRDETALGSSSWGTAIPVDPGDYTIKASANGKKQWTTTVSVAANGDRKTVTVPALEDAASPRTLPASGPVVSVGSAPLADPTGSLHAPADAESSQTDGGSGLGPQRTAALAVVGAGVISVAVGTIFGIHALGKLADSKQDAHPGREFDYCDGNQCGPAGTAARNEARSAGTASTISLLLGGGLLGGGAALWFLAKPSTSAIQAGPSIGKRQAGLTLKGSF
jgi:hypothetical protein